jgi:hypothetical protein
VEVILIWLLASTTLVSKLNLYIVKHIRPYRLQWLNNIGKYVDEVLCDVVPIQASHILLGRPW